MKKLISLILAALLLLTFAGCAGNKVELNIGKSERFSEKELSLAVNYIKRDFPSRLRHSNVTLIRISYDEKASNEYVKSYVKSGARADSGVSEENVIMLYVDFFAGENDQGFTPNQTYTNYQWALERKDAKSPWVCVSNGYA